MSINDSIPPNATQPVTISGVLPVSVATPTPVQANLASAGEEIQASFTGGVTFTFKASSDVDSLFLIIEQSFDSGATWIPLWLYPQGHDALGTGFDTYPSSPQQTFIGTSADQTTVWAGVAVAPLVRAIIRADIYTAGSVDVEISSTPGWKRSTGVERVSIEGSPSFFLVNSRVTLGVADASSQDLAGLGEVVEQIAGYGFLSIQFAGDFVGTVALTQGTSTGGRTPLGLYPSGSGVKVTEIVNPCADQKIYSGPIQGSVFDVTVTDYVSGTCNFSYNVTTNGPGAEFQQSVISDGGSIALGATTDAAAAGDGSLIAIVKQLRALGGKKVLGGAVVSSTSYAHHITTSTTTTPTASTCYLSSLVISCSNAGTTWNMKVQDKGGTPKILIPSTTLVVSSAGVPLSTISLAEPILMTGGIDIITTGVAPGVIDVFATVWQ